VLNNIKISCLFLIGSVIPSKEFKKVRKEMPGYRKLEKKVGCNGKGKVKVNKGERRKWYV